MSVAHVLAVKQGGSTLSIYTHSVPLMLGPGACNIDRRAMSANPTPEETLHRSVSVKSAVAKTMGQLIIIGDNLL